MRKSYLKLTICIFLIFPLLLQGHIRTEQETWYNLFIPGLEVPPLIFTEFRAGGAPNTYIELTNVGDEPIDLSNFSLISGNTYFKMEFSTDSLFRIGFEYGIVPLTGSHHKVIMLDPGESYVMSNVFDAQTNPPHLPIHNVGVMQKSDYLSHFPEETTAIFLDNPEYNAFGRDSISEFYAHTRNTPNVGYYLQYAFTDSLGMRDSTIVDNVNFSIDDQSGFQNDKWGQGNYQTPVAGVADAISDYILIRKADVKKGNTNWHMARGTDMETSEWLPIPQFNHKFNSFTTIGEHGDFDIDYTIKNPKISIDEATGIMTVPWELSRGEVMSEQFDFGPGMGWAYNENANDSLFRSVRNGDTFTMYAVGNEIRRLDLTIIVTDPTSDVAIAYPKRIFRNNQHSIVPVDVLPQEVDEATWRGLFQITQGLEIDSIYNVPFGTPVDSLMKYIYIPDNASAEIEFLNNEERNNLKKGDKLVVTSANGNNKKEYLIEVSVNAPSSNANLSKISWPGYDDDVYWEWTDETIPGFNPNRTAYTVQLTDGTKTIPALQFTTERANSTVNVTRAIDINGSLEQRTTTAVVTAPDGISTRTYRVTFEIETVPVQPNTAEPFISELMQGESFAYAIEIFNPGNVELDLDGYVLLNGAADHNLAEALEASKNEPFGNDGPYRYQYAFGKRFKHDTDSEAYGAEPGYLIPDNLTNTIVAPGGVFTAGTIPDGAWPGGRFDDNAGRIAVFEHFIENLDFTWFGYTFQHDDTNLTDSLNIEFRVNSFGRHFHRYRNPAVMGFTAGAGRSYNSIFLLKIENDSVRNGLKDIYDPNDYTVVDRFQKAPEADKFYASGWDLRIPHWQGWSIRRKPHVWRGVTQPGEGIGDDLGRSPENSEWIIYNSRTRDLDWKGDLVPNPPASNDNYLSIGAHEMNTITNYLSNITSLFFEVTPGYEGNLTITGDLAGLNVETFYTLIDKADVSQTFEMYDGTTLLTMNDVIADGYLLKVTSGNGMQSTTYVLVDTPLSSDNLLIAKDGSGLSVSLSGPEGIISGVELGSTIKEFLDNLIVPEHAVLNVIDNNNNLIPLVVENFSGNMIDATVNFSTKIEVVAQDGQRVVYSLDFGTTESEAILLSSVLNVDQDMRLVGELPVGINTAALNKLVYANEGATFKIIDKLGFERDYAENVNYDDLIEVTSADGSTSNSYKLKFVGLELVGTILSKVTFIINDTEGVYPDGFMLKGSWNTMTGEYDSEWSDGAEHTRLYDDGTHGDAIAGDNIWTVTLDLVVDNGENTWEWGFNDMEGNWIPTENIQFKIEDAQEVVTTYTIGTSGIQDYGKNFRVYPNPASNELSIIGIDVVAAKIYTLNGMQLKDINVYNNNIDISRLNTGVYVLRIIDKHGNVSLAKFIKK